MDKLLATTMAPITRRRRSVSSSPTPAIPIPPHGVVMPGLACQRCGHPTDQNYGYTGCFCQPCQKLNVSEALDLVYAILMRGRDPECAAWYANRQPAPGTQPRRRSRVKAKAK